MELRRYVTILRRRIWLIALAVAMALAFTAATADRTKLYTAQSTLYVGANSFSTDQGPTANLSGDQANGVSQLIRTFATMIDSDSTAQDAISRTGLPRSAGAVVAETTAGPIVGTNILLIFVSDPNPSVAQTLATGMAEAFVAKIGELEPGKALAEGAVPQAPVRIFERAKLPTVPKTASTSSSLIVAAMLAALTSAGVVLFAEYLDITVKSREDAEDRLELPVLGIVPILPLNPEMTIRRAKPSTRDDLGIVRDA